MLKSSHSKGRKSIHAKEVWAALFLLALPACQSAAPVATEPLPGHVLALGRTPEPSQTSTPSQTATAPTATSWPGLAPSPTPFGTLSEKGPWFLYAPADYSAALAPQCCGSSGPPIFLYLTNSDGSGRTWIYVNDYRSEPISAMADPANRLVVLGGIAYLIPPDWMMPIIVNRSNYAGDTGEVASIGDNGTGLLASFEDNLPQASPELVLYRLPSLEVQDRIPLIVCPPELPDCLAEIRTNNVPDHRYPRDQVVGRAIWSPDGRYLAFAAIRRDISSDLYLYDSSTGSTQAMSIGPEDIGEIWWSPDGRWIIFESVTESSSTMEAITPDRSQVRQLYTAEIQLNGLSILRWLDSERFLTTEGWIAGLMALDNHRNLRMVDLAAGQVTTLFAGEYMWSQFDPVSGITILQFQYPQEPGSGWVTLDDPTLRRMALQDATYYWDYGLKAFVYSTHTSPCPPGEFAAWTPDVVRCIQTPPTPEPPVPAPSPSPDGRWTVRMENGIWLEAGTGGRTGQIGTWMSGQVIWRPDSLGFFLVAGQELYYVSVPDLVVTLVDNRVEDRIDFQWIDAIGN